MVSARVKINEARLGQALQRDLRRTSRELRRGLDQYGFAFRAKMDARFGAKLSGPFKRNPTGPALAGRLASRSGALRRAIGHVVKGGGRRILLLVFVGDAVTGRYARTQEFGAVIRGSPWLTVPLPANLTPTGRTRFLDARSTPGAFFARSGAGNILIGRKTEGGVEWMWVLKRSVKIPPRLGFIRTFELTEPTLNRILNRAIERALRRRA